MPTPIGVAVLGAGRAGRARARALQRSARARLVRWLSRERPESGTLADALADPAVAALIVCTPNLLHAGAARAALAAGRHVAVEFPLAASPAEARALFELARRAGRVLHVEHIELLSPAQLWLRERARALGRPQSGVVRFSSDASGWIADPRLAGSPALGALARLHRLVDLFGPGELRAARLEEGAGPRRLEAELGFAAGGLVTLIEERAPGLARATEWSIECARGRLDTPPPEPGGELFARDLELFLDRIESGAPSYLSEARELEVLELVAAIEREL
ncbi:MAG TPA: Gfo/Idh/MocA family oxidoreductase [Myxococcota bacterium]|nr:Gfo/Idh/MocA family oxidoreductase [Myxococcota bacterium]